MCLGTCACARINVYTAGGTMAGPASECQRRVRARATACCQAARLVARIIYIYIYIYIYICIHTYIHTYIHTHTYPAVQCPDPTADKQMPTHSHSSRAQNNKKLKIVHNTINNEQNSLRANAYTLMCARAPEDGRLHVQRLRKFEIIITIN